MKTKTDKPTLMVYVKLWTNEVWVRHDGERHDFKLVSGARKYALNFGFAGIQVEFKPSGPGLKPRLDALMGKHKDDNEAQD